MADEDKGAAGAGAGGEGKGGAGADDKGAGGAQGGGAQGGAGGQGQQGGDKGAGGAGGDDSRSLAGGAGLQKDDKGAKDAGKDGKGDEAKAEAEKVARAELEKTHAKDLEGKSDAEKKAFLDKKMAERAGQDDKSQGAPKEYADFKLPEGLEIDAQAMTGFKELARTMDLSQEKAQKLVDLQASIEKSRADAAVAEFDKTWKSWRKETVDALGPNLEAEQANVGRFIERFGGPNKGEALRKLMDATRVGENVVLFKAMAEAGAKLSEGKLPEGGGAGAGKDEPGKRWYPNMREQIAGPAK